METRLTDLERLLMGSGYHADLGMGGDLLEALDHVFGVPSLWVIALILGS